MNYFNEIVDLTEDNFLAKLVLSLFRIVNLDDAVLDAIFFRFYPTFIMPLNILFISFENDLLLFLS